jgi:thioredoxin 1
VAAAQDNSDKRDAGGFAACAQCPSFTVISWLMDEPKRAEIDSFTEPTVLEFGAPWCGYCQAAQADIASVMKHHPTVRHIKIEDGKGRPLGRSFRVKLWPTLIYLEKGVEKGRVTRPNNAAEIEAIFTPDRIAS